jgi:hypothetical protein
MKSPSVTTVLSPFTDWDKIKRIIGENGLAYAADRGTRAHAACTAYALGFPVVGLQDDCRGFLDSFRQWFDAYVERVLFAEKRLHCKTYYFHGKADLCVQLIDGRVVIVDLKTPVLESPTWRSQVAAYKHLANIHLESIGEPLRVSGAMALQIKRDGKTAKARRYDDTATDFDNFLHALVAFRAFKL